MDISVGVRPLFVAAGWQSARRVRVDGRVPQLHPAHGILQEVGDLHVGGSELGGIECARSDLEFRFCEAGHDILSTWSSSHWPGAHANALTAAFPADEPSPEAIHRVPTRLPARSDPSGRAQPLIQPAPHQPQQLAYQPEETWAWHSNPALLSNTLVRVCTGPGG